MEHCNWRCERKHIWYENCLAIKHQAYGEAGRLGFERWVLCLLEVGPWANYPLGALLSSFLWKITPPSCGAAVGLKEIMQEQSSWHRGSEWWLLWKYRTHMWKTSPELIDKLIVILMYPTACDYSCFIEQILTCLVVGTTLRTSITFLRSEKF